MRGSSLKKHAVELLEEICSKNNWGSPIYQLLSTTAAPTREGQGDMSHMTLYLYKVSIPALSNSTFQPNKLCRDPMEAKNYAAEYTLLQLGMQLEGCESPVPDSPTSVPMSPVTSAPQQSSTSTSTAAAAAVAAAAMYQGRPIMPSAAAQYAAAGLHGLGVGMDPLTTGFSASIPLVVSSATSAVYPSVVSPTGKLPSATPPQIATYPAYAYAQY
jgi:hypothetical protein